MITEERKFFKKREDSSIEFQSELSLSNLIAPDSYVYGVLSFDYRALSKNGKSVFRILEEGGNRAMEIKDFAWLE